MLFEVKFHDAYQHPCNILTEQIDIPCDGNEANEYIVKEAERILQEMKISIPCCAYPVPKHHSVVITDIKKTRI